MALGTSSIVFHQEQASELTRPNEPGGVRDRSVTNTPSLSLTPTAQGISGSNPTGTVAKTQLEGVPKNDGFMRGGTEPLVWGCVLAW